MLYSWSFVSAAGTLVYVHIVNVNAASKEIPAIMKQVDLSECIKGDLIQTQTNRARLSHFFVRDLRNS